MIVPAAEEATPAPSGRALAYFDGMVDPKSGTMSIVVRSPAGAITSQTTLPYGTASGDVFFHTCPTPTSGVYNPVTHQLTGNVQGVNLMGGTVGAFNAVVDSISATGVTLATGAGAGGTSGIIASYGSTAPNTANCASTQPWAFQDTVTDSPFTFKGHADGTPPGIITVIDATYGPDCESAHSGGAFNVTPGNETSFLMTACNGKAAPCTFPSSGTIITPIGDPAVGCQKDWSAHYKCDNGATKELFVCGSAPPNGGTDNDTPGNLGLAPPKTTCEAAGSKAILTCP